MNNPLRQVASNKHLKSYLFTLVILALALGVAVVPFERQGQIHSLSDGVWWAITTVTGVGYGDLVPLTLGGRIIGMVLMTVGVVLFSLIVVVLSAGVFRREEKYWNLRMRKDLDSINNKLYRLEHKLEHLIKEK